MLSSLHWRILVPPSTQVRSGKRKCRTLARKIERNTKQIIFIALSFFSHEIEIVPRRKIFSVATFSFLPIMSCACVCVCVCACLSVCVCVFAGGWVSIRQSILARFTVQFIVGEIIKAWSFIRSRYSIATSLRNSSLTRTNTWTKNSVIQLEDTDELPRLYARLDHVPS